MPFKLNFFKPYYSLSGKNKKRMSTAILFTGLIFVLATSYVLYIPQQKIIAEHSLQIGDIVKEDIKIKKDITVEDTASTIAQRKQAIENVVPVYEYYEENQAGAGNLITQWFQLIAEARKDYIKNQKNNKQLTKIKDRIEKEFGLEFDEKEIRLLLRSNFFTQMDLNTLLALVNSLYDKKILRSSIGAKQSEEGTIKLISKTGEPMILAINKIYDLNKAKTALIQFIKEQGFSNEPVELIAAALMNFIQENISYSLNLTQEEMQQAAAAVNPVSIRLKTGKVILREGDEVTPEDMKILDLIASQAQIQKPRLSNFFLIAFILAFLTLFGGKFFKVLITRDMNKDKIFVVMGTTLLISAIVYRVSLFLFPLILNNTTLDLQYETQSIFYAIPFGFSVLVFAFIFDLQGALIFSFVNAMIGGIICDWDFRVFFYILLGNLMVSYGIEYYQRLKRSPIIKAAVFWLLPTNMLMIVLFHLTESSFNFKLVSLNVMMGFFSALVSPILANFIIPIWEMLFQLVTELKLIELTNLNLPIFREMLEKAPGTYHHSQMVASLAESAAQDLGLSPLLQRAMALYHDIGKIDNPHFFSENHTIYQNPHHNMPPRDSAKNIIAHIPDGIEQAEKLGLPSMVFSSIRQHHGTKVVRYFYDKAREMSSVGSDELEDKVFRYPGEKPKNIENAIIMLADQVEAASKSLASPTDEEIKNVIRKIIDADIEENQFDECEGLTIKNLNIIANSFLKKLSSIYHMRVPYPGFDFKEKKEKYSGNGLIQTNSGRLRKVS